MASKKPASARSPKLKPGQVLITPAQNGYIIESHDGEEVCQEVVQQDFLTADIEHQAVVMYFLRDALGFQGTKHAPRLAIRRTLSNDETMWLVAALHSGLGEHRAKDLLCFLNNFDLDILVTADAELPAPDAKHLAPFRTRPSLWDWARGLFRKHNKIETGMTTFKGESYDQQ